MPKRGRVRLAEASEHEGRPQVDRVFASAGTTDQDLQILVCRLEEWSGTQGWADSLSGEELEQAVTMCKTYYRMGR
jgi:hypothetical protein